jgi:hypothetical protein
MSRGRRALLALLGGIGVLCACQARPDEPLVVRSSPVPLQEDQPDRARLGPLRFEAGFALGSADPRFGGFSGLWIAPDGRELMMVSDRGTIWRAGLDHAGDRLVGLTDWQAIDLGRIQGEPGGRLDAEALAADADDLIIAVEGREPLRRVARAAPGAPAQPMPGAAGLTEAGAKAGNAGIETLTALPEGGLLAISEGVLDRPGQLAAWRIDGDRVERLTYALSDGFVPTGADWLDDRVYLVERRLSLLDGGFASRLSVLDLAQIGPGAVLDGRELARLARPMISENFEGIAVRRGADGRILLYLISDDNFSVFQRTLLLEFSLELSGTVAQAGRSGSSRP